MTASRLRKTFCLWILPVAIALLCGCKTAPKPAAFTFYPPAPDEPRIQYLTSFGAESQLKPPSGFNKFVLGGDRVIRPIWKPYGITTTAGKVFVADTQPKNVGTVDLQKRTLRYLRPTGSGAFRMPIGIAVDADGTKYVTDTVRHQVLVFDPQGKLKTTIGQGREIKPCGIALHKDRLFVTDLSNNCVRVYAKATLKELFTVPKAPVTEQSVLRSPTNIALDQEGNMYVSDTGGFAIQIYDANGDYVRSVGEMGITPGRFGLPKGVGVTRDGSLIYVVDAAANVAQIFDKQGRILMYFGQPDTEGALYLPAGLAVDYENVEYYKQYVAPGYDLDHLIFITNQAGVDKVSVYGFVKKK
jgi:DNA-binding beta-propeller fold protein YncE